MHIHLEAKVNFHSEHPFSKYRKRSTRHTKTCSVREVINLHGLEKREVTNIRIYRNSIRLPDAYAHFTKKQLKLWKTTYTLNNVCIYVKFMKKSIFLWSVKKDKDVSSKALFMTNFFYTSHTNNFFVKRLCVHVTCKDVHVDFFIFFILKSL
jgi:hypothetical protein